MSDDVGEDAEVLAKTVHVRAAWRLGADPMPPSAPITGMLSADALLAALSGDFRAAVVASLLGTKESDQPAVSAR